MRDNTLRGSRDSDSLVLQEDDEQEHTIFSSFSGIRVARLINLNYWYFFSSSE